MTGRAGHCLRFFSVLGAEYVFSYIFSIDASDAQSYAATEKRRTLNLKKKFAILTAAFLLLLPFSVSAAEPDSGIAVNTASESAPKDRDTAPHREPVRQSALTEEQEAEGWKMIGGYAFPPEALEGDAGISMSGMGEFADEDGLVTVTFDADVPDGETEPYVLYFSNVDNYQEYYVELYASNQYEQNVKLPVGAYYFTGGGPENDYMSVYEVTSPESFVVDKTAPVLVTPVVRPRGYAVANATEAEEEESLPEKESLEQPDVEAEKKSQTDEHSWQFYLLLALLLVGGGIGVLYVFYKQQERKN